MDLLQELTQIVSENNIFSDLETRRKYGQDHTEDLCFPPAYLLKPQTVEEISSLMKFANQHQIPVVPNGSLTGLSGGALSVHGGIGLSMEKFNQILEIDENNLQVTVEPAVITQVLQ
jgi:glycolate oxidase